MLTRPFRPPFFNLPDSPEKVALDRLIDADEVALVGVVLAELLQGCRTLTGRATLSESLLALLYLEVTQTTWLRTGDLSAQLLRKGVTLPLSDLLIATLTSGARLPRLQPGYSFQEDSWPAAVHASLYVMSYPQMSPARR